MPALFPSYPPRPFILLFLAAATGVGCQGFAPPPDAPLLGAATAPVYVEPAPGFGPPPLAGGGIPGFPESPQRFAQPAPAFSPPSLGNSNALAPQFGLPGPPDPAAAASQPGLPNPLKVPVANHDYAWDQIVDVVSDYFPVSYEERVRLEPPMWTEGRVETPYQVGATLFEPQRKDSVGQFNLWQSTLQTIRRRAIVRVVPEADGYQVELRIDRELEDLPKPEAASAGVASLRNDSSLPSAARQGVSRTEWSQVWVPLGRDTPLEQEMLAEIQARLVDAPRVPMSVAPVP